MALLLYVEDHPPAQMLMQAIVAELTQHELVLSRNGEEARTMAATRKPALYIVDLDLPDTDGLALIKALKQIHRAPALLVSAYAEAVTGESMGNFGSLVFSYLAKPLDPVYVAQTIERALA
jgi:two-component system KDP operon response regulator KdpE